MQHLPLSILIWLFAPAMVYADVLHDLAEKHSFAGRFTQRVISPEATVLETATGQFRLLRPDYFWWEIESPERQLLIAVGDTLTQIDWDLEVVVEREITNETRSSLHWLLAPRSELESAFEITLSDAEALLTPVGDGSGVLSIAISRVSDEAWTLRITDLGRQVLEFSLLENPELSIEVSAFDVPETAF